MPLYTKESLERLRGSIDLVEVLSSHLELKKAGAAHKALCPFHDEKTPSFTIQRGDTHYHCYGCGAHGDAIQFLMHYLRLSFTEAVEHLAEQFHVPLEKTEEEQQGIAKAHLREALEIAHDFFHCVLLHTQEGKEALDYLFRRGLSLDFIKRFELGYAPASPDLFQRVLREKKISQQTVLEAGLLNQSRRPFFHERITFPIRSPSGSIIGFSARKIKEETFGGKYINTPETALFKKSRLLFGLSMCRRQIAKQRQVILVEGQIDCLRLIDAGLDNTVASLGTAFGEGHVRELQQLGVRRAEILFDGDTAGEAAASKTGNLFQKVGIDVGVVSLPQGSDPDSFLTSHGTEALKERLSAAEDYLTFQVAHLSKQLDAQTPAGKNELVATLSKQIREWDQPVMIHESLRKAALLTGVPEQMLGIRTTLSYSPSPISNLQFNPDRILELDLLRWLILVGGNHPELFTLAKTHLREKHFTVPICRQLFTCLMEKGAQDGLSLLIEVAGSQEAIDEIMQKKINPERADIHFPETVQKILDRAWLAEREAVKQKIHSGNLSEDEVLALAKEFDALKEKRPQVV